mgnify:CR=1 FL=1
MKRKLKTLTSDEIQNICRSKGNCKECPLNPFGDFCSCSIVPYDENVKKQLDEKYGNREIEL